MFRFRHALHESAKPRKSALLKATFANLRTLVALWRQRSPDPQYAGQRVLSTASLLRAFLPAKNPFFFKHLLPDGTVAKAWIAHNIQTSLGIDWEAQVLGGGSSVAYRGTSTSAPTSTTLTDTGASWTTNAWKDHVLVAAPTSGGLVFARIVSNTGTVITFDRWTDGNTLAANNGTTLSSSTAAGSGCGAAASTPSGASTQYCIIPGGSPALYLLFDTSATTPAAGTVYSNLTELSITGVTRTPMSYGHTAYSGSGASTYTMTKNVTNGSGSNSGTINNVAMITTETGTGTCVFVTALSPAPNLGANDQLQINP